MLYRGSTRIIVMRQSRLLLQQARLCSSEVAVETTEKENHSSKSQKVKQKAETKLEWSYLVGLSRYTSRKDLELLMGSFQPTVIEPMLSVHHMFSGAYGFKFATPEEQTMFRKFISSGDAHKSKVTPLKVFEESWFDPKRLMHASAADVTNKTLRCTVGNQSVTNEHLVNFFENYDLKHENIKKYVEASSKFHYLLHFRSPEEAERAAIENDKRPFHRDTITLETYQC